MRDVRQGRRRCGPIDLDETDRQLIALLREDGRVSTRKLARALDVSEFMVRARIRRLEETNTMRVAAITDFFAAGYDLLIQVGIQVAERSAREVAAELARIPEVLVVTLVSGAWDIETLIVAENHEALRELLTEKLARIRGIWRLDPGLALDVLKYQTDWARLTR
jgi:Lrp/AsnC family transcriptional regulator for asnA, asnC and gidA